MPYRTLALLGRIALVQSSYAMAGQLGPSRDGPSASFVPDQSPCQIEAAAMVSISILCDSHLSSRSVHWPVPAQVSLSSVERRSAIVRSQIVSSLSPDAAAEIRLHASSGIACIDDA